MFSSETEIPALRSLSCRTLMTAGLKTKLDRRGNSFSLCSIINAKSGRCGENCRFCAQSSHHRTNSPVYPLKNTEEIVADARKAKKNGANHFSIVTSGRGLHEKNLDRVIETVTAIRDKVGIKVCASLGILNTEDFKRLKKAGLARYHHNLESSREFFPKICSSHTFQDRLDTIKAARLAGLEICSGGIIGLGESEEDRVSLALTLKEYDIDSAVINILIPLAGTPMADHTPMAVNDILRTIALFRLILPDIPLRLAAGRETALADFLSSAFLAGADGMMIGGYLTRHGRSPEKDLAFIQDIKKIWTSSLPG